MHILGAWVRDYHAGSFKPPHENFLNAVLSFLWGMVIWNILIGYDMFYVLKKSYSNCAVDHNVSQSLWIAI